MTRGYGSGCLSPVWVLPGRLGFTSRLTAISMLTTRHPAVDRNQPFRLP
jgi:hypothetical protein